MMRRLFQSRVATKIRGRDDGQVGTGLVYVPDGLKRVYNLSTSPVWRGERIAYVECDDGAYVVAVDCC